MTLAGSLPSITHLAPTCYSREVNDWICPAYVASRSDDLVHYTLQHIYITVLAVLLGLVVAIPMALVARRFARLEGAIMGATTVLYTVPSLAMFSLLVAFSGLTATTTIVGLGLYSLTILVRNTLAGLRAVPEDVRESAIGLGYGPTRLLFRVEMPLALPVIMAGVRVATVSTVALTTVGVIVSYGGLGNMLQTGIDDTFKAQIFTTSVLCVLLALAFDLGLVGTQRILTPWNRGRR